MAILNYIYCETDSVDILPEGDGWQFWSMRITPNEAKAVWRKLAPEAGE